MAKKKKKSPTPSRTPVLDMPAETAIPEFESTWAGATTPQPQAPRTPSYAELPFVPKSQQADYRAALKAQMAASQSALDELINKTNAQLAELESINPADVAAEAEAIRAQYEKEYEAADAEAKAAEAEADAAISAAVRAGIIKYSDAPAGVKKIINELPEFKDAGIAAATAALQAVGVEGLVGVMEEIRKLYPDISSDDALMLLRFDPRFNAQYMKRFAGNKMLMDAGFAPLDDKEYLSNERAYNDIFSAYDLPQFNNRDRYAKLIGGRVSPDSLATRVSLVADRVMKGIPEVRAALNQFYPELTDSDLMAYGIDPLTQLPALQRKIQAAELGGAALLQGLGIGLQAAPTERSIYSNVRRQGLSTEELMAQGTTLAEARKGYAAVAEVLPTAEKLSSIYAGRLEQFGRQQAEEAEFKQLASAKRAKKALSEAETAAFSGESGRGATSLTRERFV